MCQHVFKTTKIVPNFNFKWFSKNMRASYVRKQINLFISSRMMFGWFFNVKNTEVKVTLNRGCDGELYRQILYWTFVSKDSQKYTNN